MKTSNPKLIAIDLSSIVKLDDSIKCLPYVSVTPFGAFEADMEAQDTIRYTIKVGKCLPLFIGQIAPVYLSEAYSWLQHFTGCRYYRSCIASFMDMDSSSLKHAAIEKYNRIFYAFDRVEQDIPIWEENYTEVLC